MPDEFQYDVFLSHSAKDKAVVRPLAERLRQEGLNPKAECRTKKEEVGFQPSAFSLLTFPNGSLAQFLYINRRPADREQQGLKFQKTIAQASPSSAAVERLQEYTDLITAADTGKIDVRPNPDTITS